ncbi:uncharacterized protein LOC117178332 isoform X1 [Belonocnema kinseyi]|uniref:uncharacterized protein LOC117178332 isoform X1 n=1 Tax=Belonocnema kinseyi TaxID=2817044 RepID=UPI00143D5716|nr:uncharacterized protein LOC117178332 isoform X1 [Belonocnema kinseyi]
MCMSRKDFATDEAWSRFLKFTIYKQRQAASCRKKNLRKSKQIGNIKELVSKLREENATAAADYLQELPEHVKQLISRMKNNKPSSPFPAHLKTFARSLHFHSPAAYEMVRQSFLKCLPCVETLNRWYCSKNYKPGVSEEIINHVSEMVHAELKKGKKPVFNLTFDEMGIKEWTKYCKQTNVLVTY